MDQSTSNRKKRHHYIPVTYLDKFSDNSGNVFAYRKDDPSPPLYLPPRAIAFEKYYYSQPLPEGGQDDNTFEDYFASIEGKWTRWPTDCGPAPPRQTVSQARIGKLCSSSSVS